MSIKKAVITAAARGERLYPAADTVQKAMLPIVDRDGLTKPVIQIIAEEAFSAGIEEICIVCAPGDEERYRTTFETLHANLTKVYKNTAWAKIQTQNIDNLLNRLHFRVQEETLGYGHAILCAQDFVNGEPFLLLLGDHLYASDLKGKSCAQQLIEVATTQEMSVSAVNPTAEFLIHKYGTLNGKLLSNEKEIYEVNRIIEKPSLSKAETCLHIPSLRMGYYLCIFGMHVLQADIFNILNKQFEVCKKEGKELQLTPALQVLAEREAYLALEVKGRRYDLGIPHGCLQAELALGLAGKGKEEILTKVLRLLAEVQQQP